MKWEDFLKAEFKEAYFLELSAFLKEEYANKVIYPVRDDVFSAFRFTPYDELKVLILGQDPYHQPNQAHGLSFSVKPGVPLPPSLRNIYQELKDDLNIDRQNGCLIDWAKQGVMMLNTALTVEASKPMSHKNKGWEIFTDKVIRLCNEHPEPVVFVLWGKQAMMKSGLITNRKHLIVSSAHPSPLSAYNGFFGSKPFSKINRFLKEHNRGEIQW